MRKCSYYEITLEKFLNFVHYYTERIQIYVVIGDSWLQNRKIEGIKRLRDFYLSEDATSEKERLLRYYKDTPLWNLHLEINRERVFGKKYASIEYALVANCHFKDIREAYLQEKKDKKCEKLGQ